MRTLILLLLAGCAACSTGAAPQARQAPQSRALATDGQGDTLARIRTLAGTPGCSSDSQCHALALGVRACGGPESYLPWSSAKTEQAEIEALGERYKEERRAANAASGAMSTCQFLPDPGAVCRAGTCQLGGGGMQAR
ncbi:hypothetical protein ACI48D_23480 [Massilia sp. LXY-6]|uniref:hypothetical protein n=1 Tax=Massilia sp. LXY-6 TaxID=3379823 RepID=UPI003EE2DFB3